MRIIPKKTKIKNTIWKNYTIFNLLIALMFFVISFILLIKGKIFISCLIVLITIIMYIPTVDGYFYNFLFDTFRFLFSKKKYNIHNLEELNKLFMLKRVDKNGLIEFTDGSYGKVIKIGQKNFGLENVEEQDIDINYFSNALKQLEINQVADIIKIDRPINFDNFSNDIFEKIKNNKNENPNVITKIKGNILKERLHQIDYLNNVFKQYASDYYIVVYGGNKEELDITANNMASEINKCGLDTKILLQKDVAIFLKYNNYHNFDEREVNDLETEEMVEWISPKNIIFNSNKYNIDGLDASVFAVSDYPLKVNNAWGHNLFDIPNTKIVMRINPIDKIKAIKRIDSCLLELEAKEETSEKQSDSRSANLHKNTIVELLNSLQAENESLYDVQITLTAYDYLKDSKYKKKIKQVLLGDNFRLSNLYSKQKEGFINSFVNPLTSNSKYERSINGTTLAAVFPFVRTYVMEENGVLLGKNKYNDYPFIFNIWKRGNLYHNSNAMVIGKSGSGKSFFLKNLIINEWSNSTRIIICDPEAEYSNLTKNLGGNLIDVGNAKEGRINPFHVYKILTEDGKPANSIITFNTHLKMLESFFKIVLSDASTVIIEFINDLVIKTYEYKGININTNFNKLKNKDYPTFSDMLSVLEKQKNNDYIKEEDWQLTRLYLQKFVTGRYSDIWNQPSTLETTANIINFNFQSLFANKNNVVANAQMLLVFRFIEQEIINARELNKKGQEIKTMIICDEAHLFIDQQYPIALDFFYQMNKRIRKYNGSFIPATQNISDWNGNQELRNKTSTILKNSQYLFVFKLSAPDMKDVIDVYKTGEGFNDEEQRIIISAATGEAFYIGSTELRSVIKIVAGEYTQELLGER